MPTLDQWREAFRLADNGRPNALADLLETEDIPPSVQHRLAAFIRKARFKNTGRPPEHRNAAGNTPLLEEQAAVYERFHQLYPLYCSDPEQTARRVATERVRWTRVKTLVKNDYTRLNRVLDARGTKRAPVRFQEAF